MTRPVPRAQVERELARARGARRLLPWAALTALGGAGIGLAAGAGLRGAGALLGLGLLFALFLGVTSVPRCPACGARLKAPSGAGGLESCPRCRVRYE